MRRNTKRVLAYVLALALILSNFAGFDMTVKAAENRAISNVSIASGQVVPAKDGVVKATVEGTDLTTLYYQIQAYQYVADIDRYSWKTLDGQNDVEMKSPSATGGEISIPVPENKGTEERKLRVAIHGMPNMAYSNDERVEFKQEAGDSSATTVDKSKLNAAIQNAGKLVKEDYTEESYRGQLCGITSRD